MSLYYESHITVEPVFDERLEKFKQICRMHHFRVADLLMQKRKSDTPARSRYDTFCTGRHKDQDELFNRMHSLLNELLRNGFQVWRYKIEDCVLDSRYDDVLGYVDEPKTHGEILSEV